MSEILNPASHEQKDAQIPLLESLHALLPEPPESETFEYFTSSSDGFRKTQSRKLRPQFEIVDGISTETYRYNPIFENDKFDMDMEIKAPDTWQWPGLNLYVEKGLVKIIDEMIGLEGKQVVSFRPEYYPFFGVLAAKAGAQSVLVDGRPITAVEELISGTGQYSHDLAKNAEQKWREGANRDSVIDAQNEALLSLPRIQIISELVKKNEKIDSQVWDNLSAPERSHYIFTWIDNNPHFSLEANRYFGGKGPSSVDDKGNGLFYHIPESQRFPYVLKFLEENFEPLVERDSRYTARNMVSNKIRDSLSSNENFSMAIEGIYLQLLNDRFFNEVQAGKIPSGERVQKAILEVLFQSTDPSDHEKIKKNLEYKFGKELSQAEIPDQSADVLFSGWGLDFLENSVDFAANASRILKNNGLFVGYVKKEGFGDGPKRDLRDPKKIKEVLEKCGFGEIIIIHKKGIESGITNVHDVGYVFFARKGKDQISTETGLIPAIEVPNSNLFPDFESTETTLSSTLEYKPIEKTWNQDVTLNDLVEKLKMTPEDISLITTSLYGPEVSAISDLDLENILRGLYCKYGNINGVLANIPDLNEEFSDSLTQFYLKQEQAEFLLEDIQSAFKKINSFESITEIEEIIRLRSEILGEDSIFDYFQRIREILSSTTLSPDVQEQLNNAQTRVGEAYSQDPGHSHVYEKGFKDNEIYFTALERERQLKEVTKRLNDLFLNYNFSFHMNLDNNSEIQSSIGRIHKVASYDYFGDQHQVYFVDQSISSVDENIQAMYSEVLGENGGKKFVFIDRVQSQTESFLSSLVWFGDELPPLITKEWEELGTETYKKRDPSQIINDIIHHASIHEIQHAYGTGELGSYLAELAFGKTPYYDLYTKVTMLYELNDNKDGLSSLLRMLGRMHDSPHLEAAAEILPVYLDAAVESGRLSKTMEEKISMVYSKNEAGHLTLNKEKALKQHEAIMKALALLERDEIHQIAANQIKNRLGLSSESEPVELSSHIPLIITDKFNGQVKPSGIMLSENLSGFSKPVETAIRQAATIPGNLEQSNRIFDLAEIISSTDIDQALEIARAIKQRYPREQALIKIASQAADKGDISKAYQILREAESLIDLEKGSVGDNFSFYQSLGDSFLMYPELIDLKNKIGLSNESYELLTAIQNQLLSLSINEIKMSEYEILIDIAIRKAEIGFKVEALELLSEIRESIDLNSSEYFNEESARHEVLLAKATIDPRKEYGVKIAKNITKGRGSEGNSYLRSLQALAMLGCIEEIQNEADRIEKIANSGNHMSEYFRYTCLADAFYRIGDKQKAREYRLKAHNETVKIAERQDGYDWGFEYQVVVYSNHPELLDDAVNSAMNISDFNKRGEALVKIGKKYLNSGEIIKGLVVLERAGEYLTDKSQRANLKVLIQEESHRLN